MAGLFEIIGLELEYMIVDSDTLQVRPAADRILHKDGKTVDELRFHATAWSNELASHVIEIKTEPPVRDPADALEAFQVDLHEIQQRLQPRMRLLGTGMHPTMKPTEMVLWPGENGPIYRAFDQLFDCRGHGWANLQSMHINLPFSGAEEFSRLMAAVRILLPLLPGMSASTPVCEGRWTGTLDYRLEVYGSNAVRIPLISGDVIPEPVFSVEEYHEQVLNRIYADLASHDPEGVLQEEWVNARGAIARFDRNAIEIRIIDTQEMPAMDLGIALLVRETLKALVEERWSSYEQQAAASQMSLIHNYRMATLNAEKHILEDSGLAALFGVPAGSTLALTWRRIAERLYIPSGAELDRGIEFILSRGTLASRIRRALEEKNGILIPGVPARVSGIAEVYGKLADCLTEMRPFDH